MSRRLLVTSGRGPAECRIAVSLVVERIRKAAVDNHMDCEIIEGPHHAQGHGPASVVVNLDGDGTDGVAAQWVGTVQWIAKGAVRANHQRKNWFVSVSDLPDDPALSEVREEDVRFEAFRAGGPGGQHQNTTDSAVRAVHIPSGITVVVREERSQHQNRRKALARIAKSLEMRADMAKGVIQKLAQSRHDALERGNPVQVIRD